MFTPVLHYLFFEQHSASVWESRRPAGSAFKEKTFKFFLDIGFRGWTAGTLRARIFNTWQCVVRQAETIYFTLFNTNGKFTDVK